MTIHKCLQEAVSSFRSYPAGIHEVINYTKHRYNNPPVYITETGRYSTSVLIHPFYLNLIFFQNMNLMVCNTWIWMGYASFDTGTTPQAQAVNDPERVKYHYQHLSQLREAIRYA